MQARSGGQLVSSGDWPVAAICRRQWATLPIYHVERTVLPAVGIITSNVLARQNNFFGMIVAIRIAVASGFCTDVLQRYDSTHSSDGF